MAHTLVPSDHVETASVYGRGDEKIGTIERLMLEKKSGTVAYAVVRCGGLLKGEVRHYPVPWDSLKYDVARKAYTTNLSPSAVLVGVEQPTCREYMPPPVRSWSWCRRRPKYSERIDHFCFWHCSDMAFVPVDVRL
jgi:hypothetical protein